MNYDNILFNEENQEDQLHILFNIIEIEIKIRKKDEKELKLLYNKLLEKNCGKNLGDYILQKHYFAYLKFLLYNYEDTEQFTNDIISTIDENKSLVKNNIIEYIRIRNVLLKVKMLEIINPEKNNKDIISHLECLFNMTKNTKEDFAICVGIKMLSLQSKEIVSFEECIKLIQEMLNILKRETLFGKSHKNILEQYLYLSGLLGYYNSIKNDSDGVIKASKKIDKYLTHVQDIIKNNEKNIQYDNLYNQYNYYNIMLKSSININNINNNSSAIKESQASFKYQWCWLCEGQYIYGHYDSGKCAGHQFTKADSLAEANRKSPKCDCGLHKIFVHVFPPINRPFESEACFLDYLFILGFWFFSVPVIFIWVVMEFLTSEIEDLDDKTEIAITIIVFAMGISLFTCFQIAFLCLITPFMLVCLIYSPFFYKFIFFFGLGDY